MSYKCPYCDHTDESYYKLCKHKKSQHLNEAITFTCDKCNKNFKSKSGYDQHSQKCIGIGSLQCKYCKEIFQNKQAKYKHSLTCVKNPKAHSNTNDSYVNNITNNNITNNVTNNTNNTNTTNNITNNITNIHNTNIITFELGKNVETKFLSDHISLDVVNQILKEKFERCNERSHLDVLNTYFDKLLNRPENKCVQKSNLRTKYSKIHLGNDTWIVVADKGLYEKIVCDSTKNIMTKLDENHNINKKMSTFVERIEPFTNNIYDDEVDLTKQLKNITDSVKYIVYNNKLL